MVREIVNEDFDGLMELYTQLHNNPFPQKTQEIIDLWNTILNDENHHIIVAVEDNKIVGYNILFSLKEMKDYNPEIYRENIFSNADTFRSVCESYAGDTCLIICIGTERQDSYEMIISKLLRKAIEENGYNYNFVTDIVADEKLKNIFSKFGFTCVHKNGLNIMERIYSKNW